MAVTVNLYAVCTPDTYTVTANANSGSIPSTTGWTGTGASATKSVTYDSTYGTLPAPTRSGYTFKGWSLLPNGYTQVEYIQSSGTQYIDTGYYWTHENIEIDFDGTVITNASNQSLFGNEEYTAASGNDRNFAGVPHGTNGTYSIYLGNSSTQGNVATGSLGTRFNLNILTTANKNLLVGLNGENKLSVTYNGTVMSRSGAYTSSSTSTTVGNIFIFANHNSARGSSDAAFQNVSAMRLYAFKMYDNGTLVRDFIPCINDSTGKAGLYDLITNTFYGNDGTGDFTAGSASYITSSTVVKETRNHTIYAVWKDETPPVIVSATPSTILDLRNYVDFNATDAGSGVAYYNITTTNTAPTTWIPVVSDVETTTETKYEYNAAWARVLHQNNHWGSKYFADSTAAQSKTNDNDLYSVLGNIASYKNSTNWEFLLQYPEISSTTYNRWTQTSNPITNTNLVTGYNAIHADWTNGSWFGMALSSANTSTFMDGQSGGSWWYAIGAYSRYGSGMPGPYVGSTPTAAGTANLWSRIDNLTNTTSTNLTRRIGDIAADGTYYVWAKDAAGNTAYKAVTINKVDTTKPTATITSTNNVAASQTVTLTLGDDRALDKYYWGTTNPVSNTNVANTTISNNPTSSAPTKTVSDGGTYYVSVIDSAGNRYNTSKVFYKTTLNAMNGSVSPASVVTMSGNSFALPNPTRSGYTFGGWYTNSECTTAVTLTSGNYKPTANTTLYAKWTPVNYTITYTMNNGTNNANNPSGYNVESAAITLQAPTKTLTFVGNYNAASGANAASGSGVTIGSDTTKNQTFAGWTGSNGSTAQTSVTIATGSTGNKSYTAHWTAVAGNTPTVTRTGYTCGWSTSSTGTTIFKNY